MNINFFELFCIFFTSCAGNHLLSRNNEYLHETQYSIQHSRVEGLSTERGGGRYSPPARPPPKKAKLTKPPKTNLGTFVVQMVVVFVFKDTPRSIPATHVCSAPPRPSMRTT